MKVIYFLTIQETNKNKLSENMETHIHNCKNIVPNISI